MRPRTPARPGRTLLAALAAGALSLSAVVATPLAAQAAEADVTGAVFEWGINHESNGGAFAFGCNFLSAGTAGDTQSSRAWTEADGFYAQSEGNVSILKPNADGDLVAPSWSTKCQTSAGTNVGTGPTSTTGAVVRIAEGVGTVDVAANTAEISWDGSFTVAYYGGATYWSAADPVLTVAADGTGTVTATASGYGTSMEDMSQWEAITPRVITLATLTGVDVTDAGFVVTPDYAGVETDVQGGTPQVRTGAGWGSFPQDFVDFQQLTGQTSYWYSSGGSTDSKKPTRPPERLVRAGRAGDGDHHAAVVAGRHPR